MRGKRRGRGGVGRWRREGGGRKVVAGGSRGEWRGDRSEGEWRAKTEAQPPSLAGEGGARRERSNIGEGHEGGVWKEERAGGEDKGERKGKGEGGRSVIGRRGWKGWRGGGWGVEVEGGGGDDGERVDGGWEMESKAVEEEGERVIGGGEGAWWVRPRCVAVRGWRAVVVWEWLEWKGGDVGWRL